MINDVPFVLSAVNVTVIRLTHAGIDVKSTDVPDADTLVAVTILAVAV
jgi:hypothetical protein